MHRLHEINTYLAIAALWIYIKNIIPILKFKFNNNNGIATNKNSVFYR